jgi:DNA polymerase elongation subunit (family B)
MVVFYPYQWHEDDNEDSCTIHIFGLDDENKNVYVRVDDFTPYAYIELERTVRWTPELLEKARNQVMKYDTYKEDRPRSASVVKRQRLYFANVKKKEGSYIYKKYYYLFVTFSSKTHRQKFAYRVKRGIFVSGIGKVSLAIHEHIASCALQICSIQKLDFAGWMEIKKAEEVKEIFKQSTCAREYHVIWNTIIPRKDLLMMPNPKIMSMDIEVYSSNELRFPKAEVPADVVFQISCVVSRQGEPEKNWKKYLLTLKNPDQKMTGKDVIIINCKNEADLLSRYAKFITEDHPDINIILGYNTLGFDYKYMIERSREVANCFSEHSKQGMIKGRKAKIESIKWSSSAFTNQSYVYLNAYGRLYIDLLPNIRRDYKLPNYTLKTVSNYFLGQTKDPLNAKGIFRCYKAGDSKRMAIVSKYCVQDTLLVHKLFEKLNIWSGLAEMAKVCCVPIITLYTKGQQIKMYSQVYKYCCEKQIVVEKDVYKVGDNDKYTGAIVFKPVVGYHKNIIPYDFKSLYPNIMIENNISYDTLVTDPNIPDEKCNCIRWSDHSGCEHDTRVYKTKPKNIICCDKRNYRFLKEPVGVLPNILISLLDARSIAKKKKKQSSIDAKIWGKKCINYKEIISSEEKNKMIPSYCYNCDACLKMANFNTMSNIYDKRQLALKISANSCYGSMGVQSGMLPFMAGAMSVTAAGRFALCKAAYILTRHVHPLTPKYIMEAKIPDFGGKLIYGDTDSNYVSFPHIGDDPKKIWEYALYVEKELEKYFKLPMCLAFELKIYRKFLILSPKRYIMMECGEDGIMDKEIYTKGVMISRRDNSKYCRDFYREIADNIFHNKDKDIIFDKIHKRVKLLLSNSYPLKEFIITKKIKDINQYKMRDMSLDPKKRSEQIISKKTTNMEMFRLRTIPGHAYLATKMTRRGGMVEAGSRISIVVTDTGDDNDGMWNKLEEPVYFQQLGIQKLDYLYYLDLLSRQLDQMISAVYKVDKYIQKMVKERLKYRAIMMELKRQFSPQLFFHQRIEQITQN